MSWSKPSLVGLDRLDQRLARSSRSSQISFSRAVSRSASRRELTNTRVDECEAIWSTMRSSTCGQIEVRSGSPAAGPDRSPVRSPMAERSGTGTMTSRSQRFSLGGFTTLTSRPPARNRATSSTGRTVADSPIRWAGLGSSASSRSRLIARCAPRLVPATACTSSMITVSMPRSASRAAEVSSRNSDSGVVIRMSEGSTGEPAPLLGGGVAGADGDRDVGTGQPEPGRGVPDADQRAAQVALHVDGERLQRRDVEHPAAGGRARPEARWPAGRSPRGRPTASCRSRWGRRRGCAGRWRSRPRRRPARAWARRSCSGTTPWWPRRTGQARPPPWWLNSATPHRHSIWPPPPVTRTAHRC